MFHLPGANGLDLLSGSRKSWFRGVVANYALIKIVDDAREMLSLYRDDESKLLELRVHLERIFSDWKLNYGIKPLDGDYKDKIIDDCPPYVCAGYSVRDYAELLQKLRNEAYQPLKALDNEIGYQCISALLVLSEAASNCVESAIKAHWEITRYRRDQEAAERKKLNEVMRLINEKNLPLISIGHKSKSGHKHRDDWQDRQNVQEIAKKQWSDNPELTIAAILRSPALEAYTKKYSDPKTLRKWLSQIDLRPQEKKTGRPKNN